MSCALLLSCPACSWCLAKIRKFASALQSSASSQSFLGGRTLGIGYPHTYTSVHARRFWKDAMGTLERLLAERALLVLCVFCFSLISSRLWALFLAGCSASRSGRALPWPALRTVWISFRGGSLLACRSAHSPRCRPVSSRPWSSFPAVLWLWVAPCWVHRLRSRERTSLDAAIPVSRCFDQLAQVLSNRFSCPHQPNFCR